MWHANFAERFAPFPQSIALPWRDGRVYAITKGDQRLPIPRQIDKPWRSDRYKVRHAKMWYADPKPVTGKRVLLWVTSPLWVPFFIAFILWATGLSIFMYLVDYVTSGFVTQQERIRQGDPAEWCDPSLGNPVTDPYLGQPDMEQQRLRTRREWRVQNGVDDGGMGM